MLAPLKEYDFSKYPMICAHRGDTSLGAPENSCEAIEAALTSGAEMVEVDIQFTTAGDIVCHHDEISGGGRYERFEDIVALATGKIYLNIELKGYGVVDELPLVPKLFEMIERYHMDERVLYSSFRPDYITELSKEHSTTIIHPTTEMSSFIGIEAIDQWLPSELIMKTSAASYAAQLSELDEWRMSDILSNKIHLSVYTINTREEFDQALKYGAKAIVTDHPRNLVQFRKEHFKL